MRDNGDEVESTVTRDGSTVYQTYQEERFGVPTVILKLISEYDDPVEVVVAVDLLPDLQIEEVGFHPDYGRENWTVDSDRMEFRDEIGPEEEVTTMYAVESLAADQLDSLLDNLSIETVDVDSADSESVSPPASGSTRSSGTVPTEDVNAQILQSKAESDPVADDRNESDPDSADSEDPAAETAADPSADGDEQDAGREQEAEPDGADDDGAEGGADREVTEAEHVVGEEEVVEDADEDADEDEDAAGDVEDADEDADEDEDAAGDVEDADEDESDEDVGAEDEAVEVETVPGAETVAGEAAGEEQAAGEEDGQPAAGAELSDVSTATLFQELQTRMSDMRTNVAKIEEFEARHGRPVEAFAELEEELATLEERVEATENDADSLAAGQEELESEVSTLQEWRDRVKSTLSALGSQ